MLKNCLKSRPGFAQSVVSEYYEFRLADGIVDEAALIKAIKALPIEAFPGAVVVMQGQMQEHKNGVVKRSCIDVHGVYSEAVYTRSQNGSRLAFNRI